MYIRVGNVIGSFAKQRLSLIVVSQVGFKFFLKVFRDFAERSDLGRLLNEVSVHFCRAD